MITSTAMLARCLAPLSLLIFLVNIGFAAHHRCDTPNVLVVGADAESATLACEGAERAVIFLQAQGLDVSHAITVRVVKALANKGAAGHLPDSSNAALVLGYPEFRQFGEWLRVPIDVEIYRALVAHEVAHVVAARNFRIRKPTIQAHEYVAYVTTFAALNPARREQVLAQFSGDGFETEQQMNTTIYLCDPFRFGAEAYRHFLKQGRDSDVFAAILAGRVLAE